MSSSDFGAYQALAIAMSRLLSIWSGLRTKVKAKFTAGHLPMIVLIMCVSS